MQVSHAAETARLREAIAKTQAEAAAVRRGTHTVPPPSRQSVDHVNLGADVPPLGRRSYVQTRFLATEDSSTLTSLVRLFV